MDSAALELSAELSTELAANDQAARVVDPRTVPVRFSTLKMFAQSPAHYLHAVQRGYDETLSMRIGSGAHAILFDKPYAVWPGRRQGNDWKAFEKAHHGETILNRTELGQAQAMVASIRAHETAMRLLFTGTKIEQRLDWEWQGRAFRSTPDAAGRTHLVDLKCLRSAEPDRVMWQSSKMGYHAQAALYRRALNQTGEHSIKECYLVVVENKAPWPVTVLRFAESALEMGDRSCALWMEQLRACEQSGAYPGYVQSIVDLELPGQDAFVFEGDEESDKEADE
jgi:hypothetical protein